MGRSYGNWGCALGTLVLAVACGGEAQRNPSVGDSDSAGAGDAPVMQPAGGGSPAGAGHGGSAALPPAGGTVGQAGAGSIGGEPLGGASGAGALGEAGAPVTDGGAGGEPAASCDPIVFDDPDFEAAVRASVNKQEGALTSADVVGLTFLAVGGIASIRGAECLTDLTSFDIGGLPFGKVTDLSPLAPLKKLEDVNVGRNPLASVAPLGELPKLTFLFMSHVPTTLDLAPLATAPALQLLYLEGDTVDDLGPLGSVSTLQTLQLGQGTLLHPEGTAKLKSVTDLSAPGVFDDATPLAALTKLKKLRIGRKPLANFAALASLTELGYLDVDQAGITDLTPLSALKKLRNLQALGNQIRDLTPLQSLPLDYLVLIQNQISDLTPLVQNPSLTQGDFIWLEQNAFTCAAQGASIQTLETRGVTVNRDCQ